MDTHPPENLMPTNAIEQYKDVFDSLGYTAVGRTELINCLRLAFLTKNHVLVWGSTGGGKTWITNEVFGSFTGADTFKLQCTRDMDEASLMGMGYDAKKMRAGRIKFEASEDGSVVKSNFVFADEMMDAPDRILRVLLGALNQARRVYLSTGQVIDNIPLHTAIATSNYRRDNEATAAVLNRILLQYQTKAGASQAERAMLDVLNESRRYGTANHKPTMEYEELAGLANIVLGESEEVKMVLPWSLVYLKNVIISEFEKEVSKKQLMQSKAIAAPGTVELQQQMMGFDLAEFDDKALMEKLGWPARLLGDRIVRATLQTLRQMMAKQNALASLQSEGIQTASSMDEALVSASRGMQSTQLLYATALLDGRAQVSRDDLPMLRYGLYPITENPNDLDECFVTALNSALKITSPTERAQAAVLMSLSSLGDLLFNKAVKIPFPKRLYSQLVPYQSSTLNLPGIEQAVNAIQPDNQRILELKTAILEKLQKARLLPTANTAELDLEKDERIIKYDEII